MKHRLFWFALVILLAGVAPASAATPVTCTSTASPVQMRAEGQTEKAGDFILTCTGGTPSNPAPNAAPTITISISLNLTDVTSRITNTSSNATDALLLIDEPAEFQQHVCTVANEQTAGACAVAGLGASVNSPYLAPNAFNVFQGQWGGATARNEIVFKGVPIAAPGTMGGVRTIRITNIRANASEVTVVAGGPASLVNETVLVSDPTILSVNSASASQTVGLVSSGLATTLNPPAPSNFPQSVSQTNVLAGSVTLTKGFGSAFKVRNLATTPATPLALSNQDLPGIGFNNESFFYNAAQGVGGSIDGLIGPAGGLADAGTRFRIRFTNVPAGITLAVPTSADGLGNYNVVAPDPPALYVHLTASEAGAFSALSGNDAKDAALYDIPLDATGTGEAVYEVLQTNTTNLLEAATIPYFITYTANPGANSPAPNVQASVEASFAPVLSDAAAATASTDQVPRFVDLSKAQNAFIITSCTTNSAGACIAPAATFFGPSGSTVSPQGSAAQSINTATGNYYNSHTDVVVPGKGLAFNFTRSYNSLDFYSGPLGFGWTHSFNVFLTLNGDGTVTLKDMDGHQVTFAPAGGGSYKPTTAGVFDTLVENGDGSFTLTRKSQTQLKFSQTGKLASVFDQNGNTQTLSYDPSGHLTSVIDSAGRAFTLAYDANNRIISLSDPISRMWQYSYDANGNLAAVHDAAGGGTEYGYQANHQMTTVIDPRGLTVVQNTYDSSGRVAAQKNGRGFSTTFAYGSTTTIVDPLGHATQHVYDGSFRLSRIIDALGGVISYTYDANNDRTAVKDQNGNTTTMVFDGQGNATSITDAVGDIQLFTYDAKNHLLTSTSGNGNATVFSYDANGNKARIQDALGNATTFVYSASGLLASKTDARGNTTSYIYDSAGNLTKSTDALGNSTNQGYDSVGRLLSLTDANGHTTTSAYDALDRLVKTTDPLGGAKQFLYDGVGNLLKSTDANGNATGNVYDAANNLVTVTDALGGVTSYTYDAGNNRTSFKNAKGNLTSYSYDVVNRLVNSTDPLGFTVSYAYDGVGNVISTKDANGQINLYSYDALNRHAVDNFADNSVAANLYDKDGNRTLLFDSRGNTTYSYDALDRLISVASPSVGVIQYAYDALGNRTALTYPDGRVVEYLYDAVNRVTQVTDWALKSTHYSYDPDGNLTGLTYPNGASSSYSYDAANRLLDIVNRSASQVLSSLTYALDKVGNRLQISSAAGGVNKYAYDKLYRLTSWTAPSGQSTEYTYDPVGNRLSLVSSGGTTAYSYDAGDRLLSAGATTFSYDHNGNQIKKTTGSVIFNYAYDALNRLSTVSGAVNSQYRYDGDGNRISQVASGGTYQYINDAASGLPVVLSESGPDGNIDYMYGLSTISETSPALQYYYQSDALGSAASLTDATGALKASYSYDPWGKLLVPIDPLGTKNKLKFTGNALDPGTGFYYLRARYYDPVIGRFINKDPSAAGNPYSYGANNPVLLTDPSGLLPRR